MTMSRLEDFRSTPAAINHGHTCRHLRGFSVNVVLQTQSAFISVQLHLLDDICHPNLSTRLQNSYTLLQTLNSVRQRAMAGKDLV